MKFYLFPKYMEEAAHSGWIVRMLRALGVIQVLSCILVGWVFGGPMLTRVLSANGLMDSSAASVAGPLLAMAFGIFSGLVSSLMIFAAAQALDDLHALRVQTEAYVAFQTDEIKMGR